MPIVRTRSSAVSDTNSAGARQRFTMPRRQQQDFSNQVSSEEKQSRKRPDAPPPPPGASFLSFSEDINTQITDSQTSGFLKVLVVLTGISLFAAMIFLRRQPEKSTANVAAYAWITTASTGIGAVPFYFLTSLNKKWLGVANALAGGMMTAASLGLILEALEDENVIATTPGHQNDHGTTKVFIGFITGIFFMILSKKYLDNYEDLDIGNLHGANARRALLIIGVMFLHSFAEGLAIGVAFGSLSSKNLGFIVSTTLAIHNVPEGLAVSLTLVAKGTSAVEATLWSVFSSLPQLMVAVPAFLFVETFIPLVSCGLGFAAGAMMFVTFHELLPEASDDLHSWPLVIVLALASGVCMLVAQYLIDSP